MLPQAAEAAATEGPIWATLVVAVLVLIGTGITAFASWRAATAAASAAVAAADSSAAVQRFLAGSDRFADWQMHKRDVYAKLLAATRAAAAKDADVSAQIETLNCFDVAILVAYPVTRPYLYEFRARCDVEVPCPTLDRTEYEKLINHLNDDVGLTPTKAAGVLKAV
jgi:hypothetical protein